MSQPGGAAGAASPPPDGSATATATATAVSLGTIAREWTRIGLTGFGGPPTHIALLRRLVVPDRNWMTDEEMEAAIAACNLLPGPASTQLAILCAQRLRGRRRGGRRTQLHSAVGDRDHRAQRGLSRTLAA